MNAKLFIITLLIIGLALTSCENEMLQDFTADSSLKSKDTKLNRFDDWGFNWQAHHFNGYLVNAIMGDYLYRDMPFHKWAVYQGEGDIFIQEFMDEFGFFLIPPALLDVNLVMQWNEALISSRGVYPESWIDSDGWITFHFKKDLGEEKWSQFQKLVAKRTTDRLENGIWYNREGEEIGIASADWETLIIVKVVNTGNVPSFMYPEYKSGMGAGLGKYKIKGD